MMKRLQAVLVVAGATFVCYGFLATSKGVQTASPDAAFGVALTDESKAELRGADTGGGTTKKCLVPGPTIGCPGKACGSGVTTCVICTNAIVPANDECSSAGTLGACTAVTVVSCANFTPPNNGTKGYCSAGLCIPYNPAITVSCGVYATCP